MTSSTRVSAGLPYPLGATWDGVRRERRGLLGPRHQDRALPLRRRGAEGDRPHPIAGVHPRGLARLLPRSAAGAALRAPGAWPLRAAGGAPVQSEQAPARPLHPGALGRAALARLALRLPDRQPQRRPVVRPARQRAGDAEVPDHRHRAYLGAGPAPAAALGGDRDLRGARQGHDQEPPGAASADQRHLRGARLAADGRAPGEARGHRDRADADPGVLRRPPPGREGAVELLGLQHHRLLRAGAALPDGRARHRRVQAHGAAAARGGHRGDPRRRLQPHRRGQPARADAELPRPRQRELLRARRPAALLLRHHRLRQQRQPAASARGADGDGFAALLGRGMPRRRLPLRPRGDADPRPRVGRLQQPVPRRGDPGPGARQGEDDLRELGPRRLRLPGRARSRRAGRSGTAGSATTSAPTSRATRTRSTTSRATCSARATSSTGAAGGPGPASTSSPRTTASRSPTSTPTTRSTTRRTARRTATATTRTCRGTAASRVRPTIPRCSTCATGCGATRCRC